MVKGGVKKPANTSPEKTYLGCSIIAIIIIISCLHAFFSRRVKLLANYRIHP